MQSDRETCGQSVTNRKEKERRNLKENKEQDGEMIEFVKSENNRRIV